MAAAAQQVMLAQKWTDKTDPTGWWMSEKLDGVRAYWSGSRFYSRQGNQFFAPAFFTKDLPKEPLDGELWCGRGLFQKTLSIIKKSKNWEDHAEDWKYVTYLVFDAPGRSAAGEKYEARVKWMENNIEPKSETTYAAVVGVCKCTGMPHLQKMLKQVLVKGGEGIMLRKPGSLYENCRSHTLLKVKFFHDEEAKVTGHENGSGRLQHLMGKIHCVLPNGVAFKIGTGFSDAQRRKPPKIGSIVSFKYQELTENGHPRFPVFLRERGDMTWADVIENAKTKVPFSSVKKKALTPSLRKQHSILFSTVPSRDQETGKKVVTTDDVDEDAESEADNLLTKKALPPPPTSPSTKKRAAGATGKRMCQYGKMCFRKNKDHLDQFQHPPPSDDEKEEEQADDADEEEEKEEQKQAPKKRAKTDTVTSPSSASPSPPPAAAAAATAAPAKGAAGGARALRQCKWAEDCYNKDPDHLKRFSHPKKKAPQTVDEFIQTRNQSQVDLADYYNFGGDEPEEEVEAILAADKNEKDEMIQRFNDLAAANGAKIDDDEDEDEDENDAGAVAPAGGDEEGDHDLRTVILPVKKVSYFEACASDDENDAMADRVADDAKTVLMKDLKPAKRQKSGAVVVSKPRATRSNSTDDTVVVPQSAPRTTRQSSRGAPSTVAAASVAGASVATLPNGRPCPFLLPELLAKAALTFDNDVGDVCCKKCKQEVGEHREHR